MGLGQYCYFSHNSPYFCVLLQSNIWITIKISKSLKLNIDIQRTFQQEECFLKCSSGRLLSRVKWNRGKSHGELAKPSFWKYLFSWSDRLDKKRVLKLSINSKQIFPLEFWPQQQWFSSHSVTPCRFWKKIRVEKWHDLYQISLSNFFDDACRNSINSFVEHFGKPSKHGHFTRQSAFCRNHLVHVLSDFGCFKFLCSNCLNFWLMLKLLKS